MAEEIPGSAPPATEASGHPDLRDRIGWIGHRVAGDRGTIHYTWDDYHHDIDALAVELARVDLEAIVAITRGGLIPAVSLSHRLGIDAVHSWRYQSYDHLHVDDLAALGGLDVATTLIVDDILDTGATLERLKRTLPAARVAVLWRKGRPNIFGAIERVDWVGNDLAATDWVVFPWETSDDRQAREPEWS